MNNLFENYRTYLRALQPDDYKKTIIWHNDDEIWHMVIDSKRYVSEEYEKKWVNDKIFGDSSNLTLAVCRKETNEFIGLVTLSNINHQKRSAIFGKMIGEKKYWGEGLGKEATMLMLYHGFCNLGLERIQAAQLIYNKASIKVNEKCGFVNEGILRKATVKEGHFIDLNMMSVLREDFLKIIGGEF